MNIKEKRQHQSEIIKSIKNNGNHKDYGLKDEQIELAYSYYCDNKTVEMLAQIIREKEIERILSVIPRYTRDTVDVDWRDYKRIICVSLGNVWKKIYKNCHTCNGV